MRLPPPPPPRLQLYLRFFPDSASQTGLDSLFLTRIVRALNEHAVEVGVGVDPYVMMRYDWPEAVMNGEGGKEGEEGRVGGGEEDVDIFLVILMFFILLIVCWVCNLVQGGRGKKGNPSQLTLFKRKLFFWFRFDKL